MNLGQLLVQGHDYDIPPIKLRFATFPQHLRDQAFANLFLENGQNSVELSFKEIRTILREAGVIRRGPIGWLQTHAIVGDRYPVELLRAYEFEQLGNGKYRLHFVDETNIPYVH